jgi:hypothetical protein
MEKEPVAVINYDPRDRPWYKAAIESGKSTWTNPYARADRDGSGIELALGYAKPLLDRGEKIIGVMNAELRAELLRFLNEKSPDDDLTYIIVKVRA